MVYVSRFFVIFFAKIPLSYENVWKFISVQCSVSMGVSFCTDKLWDFFRLKIFWDFFTLKGFWSCSSAFSSKIIRHIIYMIRTYIVKIQSRNLVHNHKLLIVPKISFKMILKTSSQKWFCFSLKFFESVKISKYLSQKKSQSLSVQKDTPINVLFLFQNVICT